MKPFTREKRFKTRSVNGTLAIAATIAEMLRAPRFVILRGELGAGKTTLVKGWVDALKLGQREDVASPTFTLVQEYRGPAASLFHLDLYRLESERELEALGLDELAAEPRAMVLVEWGEKFASVLERADAIISITHGDGDERSLLIEWRD